MRRRPATETDEFLQFWDVWKPMARHTDGRGLAREAFNKHVANGADPQDIIDGARWFLRGVKDKQYVPLSATWLNREPWPDLCEQERSYQQRQAERNSAPSNNIVQISAPRGQTAFLKQFEQQKAAGE